MFKRLLLILHTFLIINSFSTTLSANTTEQIIQGTNKVISGAISKVEIALKGKKLKNYFNNNNLNLNFDGKNKEYRFKVKTYEVFIKDKLEENGKWKVHGLIKGHIKLSPEDGSQAYYFKKISKKEIIYLYDKVPGSQDANKTLVNIDPLEKKEEPKKIVKKEEPKVEEPKKVIKKEESKVEEPKKVIKKEELKKEEPKKVVKKEEPKKIVKIGKVPDGKKRIYKYVCDANKSEYYWGINKNNMKLSRYEDSPYEQWQRSRGFGNLEDTGVLWSVTEIDFHDGYLYLSGSMQYDANSNGKLDIVPYADRVKIKTFDESEGSLIGESEYHLENPDTEIFTYEIEFDEFTYTTTMENTFLPTMNAGPKYWEKYSNQCIRTEYFVDKNSGERLIEFYNKQKPLQKKAYESLFGSSMQNEFQAHSDSLFKDINEQIANEINIIGDEYKNISKNINQNKNLNNESQKFVKEVSKDQLKQYKATSVITYYFFESQANYLASLELLYRAYDKNVEADKMKAQINYLKDSKSSENKRLKSTMQIIDDASKNIKSDISDNNKKLSEESKVLYQKSLPFAFKATEYGYKVFVVSTTVGKNITNSKDKIGSILSNFNEVIGFASIIPEIPSYVKTVGSTSKLIFTGAKVKKIKDEKNLGDALDELDLSA
jgi:hypothetical protein